MKKLSRILIVSSVFVLVFSFAAPTFAAGLTSQQVSSVIALLQSFGVSQSVITNVEAALAGVNTVTSVTVPSTSNTNTVTTTPLEGCVSIPHNLYKGMADSYSGGEVTKLQAFLGMPRATGYFGSQTEQMVQEWQTTHNVVSSGTPATTGWGVVGPLTRATMECAGPIQPPDVQPSITPTSVSIVVKTPSGGENIGLGRTSTITWNATGIPSTATMNISLVDDSISCNSLMTGCWSSFGIGTTSNATESYVWDTSHKMLGDAGPNTAPVTPGAKYKIKVCTTIKDSTSICGESSGYFNIVAPTS